MGAAPVARWPGHLLLFDGVCNLCNGLVGFVIRHDKRERFRFASLQSEAGQRFLKSHGLAAAAFNTLVYYRHGRVFTRSAAALNVARDLGGFAALAYGLIILPRFLRDALYAAVARRRYQWFGKRETCMVPTKELEARFL